MCVCVWCEGVVYGLQRKSGRFLNKKYIAALDALACSRTFLYFGVITHDMKLAQRPYFSVQYDKKILYYVQHENANYYSCIGTSFKNDAARVMRSNFRNFFSQLFTPPHTLSLTRTYSVCSIIGTSFFLNKGWTSLYTYS